MARISSDDRVVIPKEVRERLGLKPGQEVEVFACDGRIELIPVRPIKEMRGFMKGLKSDFKREPDRLWELWATVDQDRI